MRFGRARGLDQCYRRRSVRFTNVGLEHTAVLGTTHAAIAFQKVGILKRGATMITGVVPDCAAGQVIAEEAGKLGCRVIFCAPRDDETIAEINTRMAEIVLDEIGRRGFITSDAKFSKRPIGGWLIDEGTRLRARLPGRMEYFELPVTAIPTDDRDRKSALTPVILDGAHVPRFSSPSEKRRRMYSGAISTRLNLVVPLPVSRWPNPSQSSS
jgi:dihydrofolate synthase / folylpolyglutamate synthase